MDFLFVPGSSPSETLGRAVLAMRPGTTLITLPARQNHVAGLLAKLGAGGSVTLPIGDILSAAHGLEIGEYYLPLSRTVGAPADFEKLVAANTSNVIRIPAALVTPSGGGDLDTITVRLKACNIGKAQPFMEKFQLAMTPPGGTLNMTAPLHFDEFHGIVGGTVEYLAHKFTLKVPTKFADRPALLAAFQAATEFTYLDGTAIPPTAWNDWVPAVIHPPASRWKRSFDMKVDLNPAVGTQTTITVNREYRFEVFHFTWTWTAPDPGNDPDRIELLRTSLPQGTVDGLHLYDPNYEWPMYERYGFTSLDDYVDNLNWQDTFSKGTHHFAASLFEYTVMLPLTDPPAAAVPPAKPPNPVLQFYNFYPKTAATGPAVLNLDETNAQLFLSL